MERSGKEGEGEPGTGVELGRSLGWKCHVVDVIFSHEMAAAFRDETKAEPQATAAPRCCRAVCPSDSDGDGASTKCLVGGG